MNIRILERASYLVALLLIILPIFLLCCQTKPGGDQGSTSVKVEMSTNVDHAGQAILKKCMDAHGGLETWQAYEGLEYTLINNGSPIFQLTQLRDRRAYLKGADFEIGFDGKNAWARPDLESVPTKSAAVYYNLDFYFMAMPFVLRDPGVFTTYEGKTKIDGIEYETLKVTFGPTVGLTPQDIYYLYLNSNTYILEMLVYSITYSDSTKGNEFNVAKIYSDYQPVQGLLMPGKMKNFEWHDKKLGDSKHHIRIFKNIKFLKTIPEPNIFQAPKDAIIEKRK